MFIGIIKVKFALLHPAARAPTVATDGSVGHDFYAVADCKIQPGRTAVVDTGVAFAIPRGVMGEVRGRSGMATRGVLTHPGTVDQDFRGSVSAILANIGPDDYHISAGHRVAQIVLSPVLAPPPAGVASFPPSEGFPSDIISLLIGSDAGGAFFTPVAITGFAKLVQVAPDELGATARGSGGLGSSGL